MKDNEFLFLTSMIRAREVRMLGIDRINRMLEASGFDDAAKTLVDCGYPDMSTMGMSQIDAVLENCRNELFDEFAYYAYVLDILDLFRMKYDYHNAKVLVKSEGAQIEADYLLSDSGRIESQLLREAFLTNEYDGVAPAIAQAIENAVGVLSRTADPQLADIEIDKAYFSELITHGKKMKNKFISEYIRFLVDSANLRIFVRSARTGKNADFLIGTLIADGSLSIEQMASSYEEGTIPPYTDEAFALPVRLAAEAMGGGSQTAFELACDNAVLQYVTNTKFISFGPAPIITYFAKLEWELTVIRMILTGKYSGIPADVIRERLRECYV